MSSIGTFKTYKKLVHFHIRTKTKDFLPVLLSCFVFKTKFLKDKTLPFCLFVIFVAHSSVCATPNIIPSSIMNIKTFIFAISYAGICFLGTVSSNQQANNVFTWDTSMLAVKCSHDPKATLECFDNEISEFYTNLTKLYNPEPQNINHRSYLNDARYGKSSPINLTSVSLQFFNLSSTYSQQYDNEEISILEAFPSLN